MPLDSLPGLPKDFVPKDPKLLLPKDFQPNKEFHPKISDDDDDDDDLENSDSYPPIPGTLPRTNAGHGNSFFPPFSSFHLYACYFLCPYTVIPSTIKSFLG